MRKIMYLFEYFCYPIWFYENPDNMSNAENISVAQLPISMNLKKEIEELDFIFQSTYNDDYPPEPKPLSPTEELSFCKRVLLSAQKMKEALPNYHIIFEKNTWQNRINELNNRSPSR